MEEIKINKKNERFIILEQVDVNMYKIKFLDTSNEQYSTLGQIKRLTCYDLKKKALEVGLKKQEKLKARARMTSKAKETVILPYLKDKKVIAIDLATYNTGIAIYYPETGAITSYLVSENTNDFRARGYNIVKRLLNGIQKTNIEFVLIEGTFLGLNSSILEKLSEIRGFLVYELMKHDIAFCIVPPNYWKNKFVGIPKKREEQKEYIMNFYKKEYGERAITDDVADAYAMLKACLGDV